MDNPQELGNAGRNPDGTFRVGHEKVPGSGRPKNTLKDFWRRKINEMTDEEKLEFSKKVDKLDIWRMAEGNPKTSVDGGEDAEGNVIPILGGITKDVSTNNSSTENTGT